MSQKVLQYDASTGGLREIFVPDASIEVAKFSLPRKNTRNSWLHVNSIPSNIQGYPVAYNGTIITAIVETKDASTGTLYVRKNNDPTNLITINLSANKSKRVEALSISVSSGDLLQAYIKSNTGISYPSLSIAIAWT